ncbi:MAG: Omp28-related outer membrane protein [Tannerella sp.]|jgi:hypothetical protein|nr:Omp28-related outer membrane protein [Tannerella sp.]
MKNYFALEQKVKTTKLICLIMCYLCLLSSCKKDDVDQPSQPQNVSLTVDKNHITANGKDYVTFSVSVDGVKVSSGFTIKDEDGNVLSGNTFATNIPGSHSFTASYNGLTSQVIQVSADQIVLYLQSDRSSITANGYDSALLTATYDNEDISGAAEIYCVTAESEYKLDGNTFTSSESGTYSLYARYKDQTSDPVTIEAYKLNLQLSVDKQRVKTNESVTFSAILNENEDITDRIQLHVIREGAAEETLVTNNVFTPEIYGKYTVYATYDYTPSDTLNIEVFPANIVLSADRESIKASGEDSIIFMISADGTTFIPDAEIFVKGAVSDTKIDGLAFATVKDGTYQFYAKYQDVISNTVTVRFTPTTFYKQSCVMAFVASWCGYSPGFMRAFDQLRNEGYPNAQTVCIHRNNSDLYSSEIPTDATMDSLGLTGVPYGYVDMYMNVGYSASAIKNLCALMLSINVPSSGIAISSQLSDNQADIQIRIKVNQTDDYRVGALIVEDNINMAQKIYPNNDITQGYYDYTFVHYGVATFIMPGANIVTGKPLGVLTAGQETTLNFSIPITKKISTKRTVVPANCRVVAYTLKKYEGKYIINNSASCPINGSIGYKFYD